MDSRYDIPRRAAGGGGDSSNSSPALGAQSRRRKMPPRPADFKLQIIIIGSRGVGKTSIMERFTDDTFCEACKSTVGEDSGRLRQLFIDSVQRGSVYLLEGLLLNHHELDVVFILSYCLTGRSGTHYNG